MTYTILASEWDAIPEGGKIAHLQSHGVPISDHGVYFGGIRLSEMSDGAAWIFKWGEV